MSVQNFREKYGEPDSSPIKRLDGWPITSGVPLNAVIPLDMSINARDLLLPDAHLVLSDFGESFTPATEPRLDKDCHTPVEFRPPEAWFEPEKPLSFAADIWTVATAICDILGMQALFSSAFYSDAEVMCQIVDTLGPLPAEWQEKWEYREKFFDRHGVPNKDRYVWPRSGSSFEERVQHFRREDKMSAFSGVETEAILELLGRMLKLKPEERADITEVLASEWLVKWVKPNTQRNPES